jgi:hypothetical protein
MYNTSDKLNQMYDAGWAFNINGITATGFELHASEFRTGTLSVRIDGQSLERTLDTQESNIGVSFALMFESLPDVSYNETILSIEDVNEVTHTEVVVQTDGNIAIFRGDKSQAAPILITTNSPIRPYMWNHYELRVDYSGAYIELRLNGSTVLSDNSGQIPNPLEVDSGTPAGLVSTVSIPGRSRTRYFYLYYDDIVIYNNSGSYNNDFIGDNQVFTLRPSADTAQADWTGSYTDIDEQGHDLEATYISASTPGSPAELTSEFEIDNLAVSSGTVAAVAVSSLIRKDDATTPSFQSGVVSGGVEARSATVEIGPIYLFYDGIFETDPNSGVAFTPSDVNSLKLQLNRV